ncbi:MAG: DNA-formamidopyrimidine glycosylase family protein [Dehalococcoidia bacterium]
MPEAPDLEVILEVLTRRVVGREIASARVPRPTVLRSLVTQDFSVDISGRTVEGVSRRGKFLLLEIAGARLLVVNPMLTGAFQLCPPGQRVYKRTCIILGLGEDLELRYLDERQMGKVYYVSAQQLAQVPRFEEQGPDALSDEISMDDFKDRLRRYHGEIKGVLTRGTFIAGIGNAYSDEVLFAAGLSPFRKRKTLSEAELKRLHQSIPRVMADAVAVLRERMGEETHHKIRDFLQVHNKGGEPCPSCGNRISQLTANQRITSFCRHCQPGMLVRN